MTTALTSSQYAALAMMDLPVWQLRGHVAAPVLVDVAVEKAVTEEAPETMIDLPWQGNPQAVHWVIGEDLDLNGDASSSKLLRAMLVAVGAPVDAVAVLAWQSDYAASLQQKISHVDITPTALLLGTVAQADCAALFPTPPMVSQCPQRLLTIPADKAAAWRVWRAFFKHD